MSPTSALHLIGIDLAWGSRQPTGVAVLDESGRLVRVCAVRTDEEIETALAAYVEGSCVVAIDAPLIVRNPTGNRPAEAALNRDFARFDAGAHPSNTGKPEFADGTRGQRIAARLGLDLNPRSGRTRRAIEVYPHPATVALFRLGRTLKYKNKPGRTLVSLRGDLLALMNLLEGLADAAVPLDVSGQEWSQLRERVARAERKSQLRVVEDQVDAVVCAYVALLAARAPERVTVYGDEEPGGWQDGYIVTPTLPPDHAPTPRERRSAGPAAPPWTSTPPSTHGWWRPVSRRSTWCAPSSTRPASTTWPSPAGPRASPASRRRRRARGTGACSTPSRSGRSPTSSASAW